MTCSPTWRRRPRRPGRRRPALSGMLRGAVEAVPAGRRNAFLRERPPTRSRPAQALRWLGRAKADAADPDDADARRESPADRLGDAGPGRGDVRGGRGRPRRGVRAAARRGGAGTGGASRTAATSSRRRRTSMPACVPTGLPPRARRGDVATRVDGPHAGGRPGGVGEAGRPVREDLPAKRTGARSPASARRERRLTGPQGAGRGSRAAERRSRPALPARPRRVSRVRVTSSKRASPRPG